MTRRWIVLFGLAVLCIASLFSFPDRRPDRPGYFRSASMDRVMAYSVAGPITEAEARAIFTAGPSTPGRVTVAVIYGPGASAPGASLTLAPDLPSALRLVGEDFPAWSWRVRVNPAGRVTVDAGE